MNESKTEKLNVRTVFCKQYIMTYEKQLSYNNENKLDRHIKLDLNE